jgi:DNA polymerase III sliding clamp (beta) subunit (PCNA family)
VTWIHHEIENGRILMSTLKLGSGHTAIAISKAIKPAISTDKTKRNLLMVEIRQDGERVRLAATDGYRLHVIYLTGAGEIAEPVTIGGSELVTALANAGKDAKAAPVSIELDGDDATVIGATLTVFVPGYPVEFPNISALITEEAECEIGAAFNGDYLSDMAKAAQAISNIGAKKNECTVGAVIETISTRKAMRIAGTSQDRSVQFTGLLMPQRIR